MVFKRKPQKPLATKLTKQLRLKMLTMKKKNLTGLDELTDKYFGAKGTPGRNKFEKGFEKFKLGVMLQQAREEKGLTQEQLAELAGTNKSYISKIEKDLKDIRFSTLQRIVTEGLGGRLEIAIRF
jgi:HTH-type transcriptional regulator / antitoxin HipB